MVDTFHTHLRRASALQMTDAAPDDVETEQFSSKILVHSAEIYLPQPHQTRTQICRYPSTFGSCSQTAAEDAA